MSPVETAIVAATVGVGIGWAAGRRPNATKPTRPPRPPWPASDAADGDWSAPSGRGGTGRVACGARYRTSPTGSPGRDPASADDHPTAHPSDTDTTGRGTVGVGAAPGRHNVAVGCSAVARRPRPGRPRTCRARRPRRGPIHHRRHRRPDRAAPRRRQRRRDRHRGHRGPPLSSVHASDRRLERLSPSSPASPTR